MTRTDYLSNPTDNTLFSWLYSIAMNQRHGYRLIIEPDTSRWLALSEGELYETHLSPRFTWRRVVTQTTGRMDVPLFWTFIPLHDDDPDTLTALERAINISHPYNRAHLNLGGRSNIYRFPRWPRNIHGKPLSLASLGRMSHAAVRRTANHEVFLEY